MTSICCNTLVGENYHKGVISLTLKGHSDQRTYGIFQRSAITTTYTAIMPSVIPCVLFTVRPRCKIRCRAKSMALSGLVDTTSLRRSAREAWKANGAIFTVMFDES